MQNLNFLSRPSRIAFVPHSSESQFNLEQQQKCLSLMVAQRQTTKEETIILKLKCVRNKKELNFWSDH